MLLRRQMLTLIVSALALVGTAVSAVAEYPKKPITVVAPYGPGGAADLAARTLSSTAPTYLKQAVLVVNRTGAGGVTGSTFVAKGRKDGYTLLLARVGSQAAVPAINRKIPYKWDDFTFLGLLEQNPFTLCSTANGPYKTFDDLAAALKAGKKVKYATAGVGTLLHVAVAILADKLGVPLDNLIHVPFKGGGKAAAAVAGGHADIIFQNLSGVINHIQGKKVNAILVTTPERFSAIPDTPTAKEKGIEGLDAVVGWSGLWGPKGMPKEAVDKWTATLQSIKKDKAWNKMTKNLGSVPSIMNPADTKAFVKKQYELFKETAERLDLVIK